MEKWGKVPLFFTMDSARGEQVVGGRWQVAGGCAPSICGFLYGKVLTTFHSIKFCHMVLVVPLLQSVME